MDGSQELIALQAVAAPIILVLVQAAKATGITPSRWAWPLAMGLGVAVSWLIGATDWIDGYTFRDDWAAGLLSGLLAGSAASGLNSGAKAVAGSG